MNIFLITLIILFAFMLMMAIGVMAGRKPLQGSCGGLGKIMGKKCDFCDNKGQCTKKAESTSE
ncbi:MAG: (Na+)-NQR maturation NqrM [Bdellovibrionota bacterium]|nr:(Na+)-NQR maturation NqrM [Deltaproteobacteria bacterium]